MLVVTVVFLLLFLFPAAFTFPLVCVLLIPAKKSRRSDALSQTVWEKAGLTSRKISADI